MSDQNRSAESPPPPQEFGDATPARGFGALVLRRFLRNRMAMVSLFLVLLLWLGTVVAIGLGPLPGLWKHDYSTLYPQHAGGRATLSLLPVWLGGEGIGLGEHPFGQSRIGQDYFAMTMRGIQNSVFVMVVIGGAGTVVGTVIGAIAGYYRGWVDAVLMRMTDVFIVIPTLVIGAVVGRTAGGLGIWFLAVLLALISWMPVARLVRAEFLSLREREFVEAARVGGAGNARIIAVHILPNAVGVVIVSGTLLAASAILLETALSYLGYGVQPPEVSLGRLISDNQSAFATRPWLYWWPAVFIVGLALLVNFVGDGLRNAFDPRQHRFRLRRTPGTRGGGRASSRAAAPPATEPENRSER
ncbi:ABC transporter permease [Leucobacter sp. M11]|uniref:ABC transporter permease n=1 Tax=Leucobacter sp. M11 TaxID=2993565 RepID=UPI002D7FEBB6|nr:ABC transporter permease [Leucobacter sp. M11]MEB4613836.1 ABC transporter permease [Leucobacter sp. M11]